MSESIKELASALSKFQGEITNPKNTAKNPQFNSKYAPLQDVLSLARPVLAKQGLSVLQSTTGDLENVTVSTMLLHESGQFMETEPFVLKGEQTARGGAKVLNVQGAGSMITYIRRYQLTAILGLASEDDDDGNHASKKDDKKEEPTIKKENNTNGENVTTKMLIDLASDKGVQLTDICKKYGASEVKFIKQDDKKKAYETLKHIGEETSKTIDSNKIESIIALSTKKGVKEHSICEAYNLGSFKEMTFEMWKEATKKLELKADKIVSKEEEVLKQF